jgi:hypothetical protein
LIALEIIKTTSEAYCSKQEIEVMTMEKLNRSEEKNLQQEKNISRFFDEYLTRLRTS